MKDIIVTWQGSNVETVCPKRIQDLESQVLNSAIIVKTRGHGFAKMYFLEVVLSRHHL